MVASVSLGQAAFYLISMLVAWFVGYAMTGGDGR